jgi:hypothetical protein
MNYLPMFTNTSFVSLYILPDCLYLICLSKDKKKITLNLKLDLPKGIIKNYKVADPSVFAKVLQTIWQKYRISVKEVSIVIPEFAVFSKRIVLPKLTVGEMHEAVLWQAQEFLPQEVDETLLDWKIAEEKEKGTEVFVVAVRKDILLSYVFAVEKANLIPLSIEIPSVSLVRLGKSEPGGSLYIYGNTSESLVVLAQNGNILASSVVQRNNPDEILNVLNKLTLHYKDISISQVWVGGTVGNLLPEIEKRMGKKPQVVDPGISNVSLDEVQPFLIPVSLAKAKWSPPFDPFSINLLPPDILKKYQSGKKRVELWGIILTITLFVWIALFATLGTYIYISQSVKTLQLKNADKSDIALTRDETAHLATRINTLSSKIIAIKTISVVPQEVLNLLYMSRPTGVVLLSYKIDFDLGEIKVSGKAPNRLSLIEFKQNLEKNPNLENVVIPISNFEAETNLSFDLSAWYKPITKTLQKKQ